jgi:acid phosphatase family membrane protein YuiD
MAGEWLALVHNRVFLSVIVAWVCTQGVKVALGVVRERRFNFKWLIGTGGMPSTHAAGVTALATAVGFTSGFHSTLFIITLIFALVIMFDAQGVRRSAGKQAEVLNKIVEDIYWKRGIDQERLMELIGHTPVEVFVGGLIGIVVAVWLFRSAASAV